jgi:hypothetical protein
MPVTYFKNLTTSAVTTTFTQLSAVKFGPANLCISSAANIVIRTKQDGADGFEVTLITPKVMELTQHDPFNIWIAPAVATAASVQAWASA